MLFYLALTAIIAGVVFLANGTTWFSGEENLSVPLIAIGVVILAFQVLLTALALRRFKREASRMRSDFDRTWRSF